VTRPAAAGPSVGELLRGWRRRRQISQLELALRAGSSARHLSFVETGRSTPGRDLLLRLADQLDVPVRDRNALLTAAGYAPLYTETPLDDPAMEGLARTLETLLRAHEPNPALVMNGHYDVVAANRGITLLLGEGLPDELTRPPMNALRLTLHPQGLAPRIRNLAEWRGHLLERAERQLAFRASPELRALYDEVAAYPAPKGTAPAEGGGSPSRAAPTPAHAYALPLRVEAAGRLLSFVSTATTFNTPMDVTVSELAIETFLPADPDTARALRDLSAAGGATPGARPEAVSPLGE
jgi:transcriptional regulator with XRE-family HTH domain